jgi:hypothetical protein
MSIQVDEIFSMDTLKFISTVDKIWNEKLNQNKNISSNLACNLEQWRNGLHQTYVPIRRISDSEIYRDVLQQDGQYLHIDTREDNRTFFFAVAVMSSLSLEQLQFNIQPPIVVKLKDCPGKGMMPMISDSGDQHELVQVIDDCGKT